MPGVRDLGIYTDSELSTQTHDQRIVSSCFSTLRHLRYVRRLVPPGASSCLGAHPIGLRTCLLVGLPAYLPSTEITVGSEKATACVVVSTLTDALVCLGRLKMLDGKMQDTDRFTTTTLVPASNVQSREDELNKVK